MKWINSLFWGMVGIGFLMMTGCSGGGVGNVSEQKQAPVTVILDRPWRDRVDGVSASGQVEAIHSVSIATRLTGTIKRVYVGVGDRVKAGQLLAVISGEDLAARKAQAGAQIFGAQADLDNAHKDYDRYTALFGKGSATSSELDNATLRYQSARARLAALQELLKEVDASAAYARLTAPFSGVVTQKFADAGSLAMPGAAILRLEESDGLHVRAAVTEADISRVRKGDRARVDIRMGGLVAKGTVSGVSVSSVETGGQYEVLISLSTEVQKHLYAGMYVNVFIPADEGRQAGAASVMPAASGSVSCGQVWVPQSALLEKDQLIGVYTVSSRHTALLRWVRTGKKRGDRVEILSGLNADETFIASSSGRLYNGVPVNEK